MNKFCVFVDMLMRDVSLKTKDSVYNTHLNFFRAFSVEKKCALYTRVNTVMAIIHFGLFSFTAHVSHLR